MRIAVVGTGISGLGAAWLLAPKHDVRVFERANRIGGHTHTHAVDGPRGSVAVDSGFIVYNETTYPLLTTLFGALGVRSQPIDMSFSFECERCRVVYSGLGIGGVFADPGNVPRPGFLGFLGMIGWFNSVGRSGGHPDRGQTLHDFVSSAGSEVLGRHYAYPLASALWSTGIPAVRDRRPRSPSTILAHRTRSNTVSGSRHNIMKHYDLGNNFFALFLDPSLTLFVRVFR